MQISVASIIFNVLHAAVSPIAESVLQLVHILAAASFCPCLVVQLLAVCLSICTLPLPVHRSECWSVLMIYVTNTIIPLHPATWQAVLRLSQARQHCMQTPSENSSLLHVHTQT